MINKIKEFLKTNKYAVIWTVCYIAVVYIVLFGLFGFNLFSGTHWSTLMRAHLRGFAGFAFGIMILAAIPLYIATMTVIVRTKKPLFKISLKKKDEKKSDAKEDKKDEVVLAPLPAGLPTELRGAFLRARQNVGNRPESVFDMKDVGAPVAPPQPVVVPLTSEPDAGLPLPDNFDFSDTPDTASSAPMFKEITFGDVDFMTPKKQEETKSPLHEHMDKNNIEYTVHGNVTVAKGKAIITHDDSDFWIADDENWFASGKQKASPITEALAAAAQHGAQPAIYLAQKNIMDIDSKIEQWESTGVKVIQDLSDI